MEEAHKTRRAPDSEVVIAKMYLSIKPSDHYSVIRAAGAGKIYRQALAGRCSSVRFRWSLRKLSGHEKFAKLNLPVLFIRL